MTTEEVKALSPLDRYLHWIRERHNIFLRRKAELPPPWSEEEIFQTNWFTNPFRENDKTTAWFRTHYREPHRNDSNVLMGTIIFRWFNRISTGEILLRERLLDKWDSKRAIELLEPLKKVFTGAFVIAAPTGMSKVRGVCKAIDGLQGVQSKVRRGMSLQQAHKVLQGYPYLGGFMAYEIVSDLRHTYLLEEAPDILTWAHPGPGCVRGMMRLEGKTPERAYDRRTGNSGWMYSSPKAPPDILKKMQALIPIVWSRLRLRFELRDCEHALCEFDKMERILHGQGTSKPFKPNTRG